MQTFIFGHRNPDTDSVCSSIALSYLLNLEGRNTVPKVLGHINTESKFVLDYFGVNCPDYLNDTKVRVKDMDYNKKTYVKEDDSISKTFKFMQKENITAIPLVNSKKTLTGFVTLKEIAKYLIGGDKESINTSYTNIVESVEGKELLHFDDEITGKVMVVSYQSKTFHDEVKLTQNDILIVGDRFKILEYAIESKVKLIVLSGNHELPKGLLKKAEKNKINVIVSKHNSFNTMNKVILSNRIISININEAPITINSKDYRTDFLSLAAGVQHTNYPIINNKNECLGLLKITSVDNYTKQKVILVDHNEFSQSADGIENAKIRMVVDHHRICDFLTAEPLYYRAEPVGCTNTILLKMYKEYGFEIDKKIAGIMLSAIISDTLLLKSPTKTAEDEEAVKALAEIAGVNYEEYFYRGLGTPL